VHRRSNVVGVAASVAKQRQATVLNIEVDIRSCVLHKEAAIALVRCDAHAPGSLEEVMLPVTDCLKQAPFQRP
jgi:hypothetical protein